MNKEYKFSLESFFLVVRRRIVWVLLISIICAVATALIGKVLMVPKYSSTAKLYVNTAEGQTSYITQSDLTVAKSLVSTYIVIIESDTTLEQVAEKAGVKYTPEQLRDRLVAGSISDTEAFFVTVTDEDPQIAKDIADAIVEVAPSEILRVVEAGSVKDIDQPKFATEPDENNLKVFTVISFIFAALVSFVIFFLVDVLDVTVYTEEDLTRMFNKPIIGIIPTIESTELDQKNKKKKAKGGK